MTPDQVLARYKTQQRAAKAIGVSKQAMSLWKTKGRIPLESQIEFEMNDEMGILKADIPIEMRNGGRRRAVAA